MSNLPTCVRNVLNIEKCKMEHRIDTLVKQIAEYHEYIDSLTVSLLAAKKDYEDFVKFME